MENNQTQQSNIDLDKLFQLNITSSHTKNHAIFNPKLFTNKWDELLLKAYQIIDDESIQHLTVQDEKLNSDYDDFLDCSDLVIPSSEELLEQKLEQGKKLTSQLMREIELDPSRNDDLIIIEGHNKTTRVQRVKLVRQIVDQISLPNINEIEQMKQESQLESVNIMKQLENGNYKLPQIYDRNYMVPPQQSEKYDNSIHKKDNLNIKSEAIVNITFYSQIQSVKETEFQCLANKATLEDLALKVNCVGTDQIQTVNKNKDVEFFLIQNQIYCSPKNVKSIQKYLSENLDENEALYPINFTTTRISDLTFKIGYPYLFRHQGSCDHIFIFNIMRLADPSQDQPLLQNSEENQGIIQTFQSKNRRQVCELCDFKFAIMAIVYQNSEHGNDFQHKAAFVCLDCYSKYINGTKHKLYPYISNEK